MLNVKKALPVLLAALLWGAQAVVYAKDLTTVVVPFSPGASADLTMRLITKKVTEKGGPSFVIDNKTGANGIVAAEAVKRAAPDGKTLLEANIGSNAINAALYQGRLSYDPLNDFVPITVLWKFPSVLVVPASSPAQSLDGLIALAKSKAEGVSYASAGTGSGGHLLGEMFKISSGAPMVHVPYKGAAPAIVDLMGGRIDFFFVSYSSVQKQVETGALKVLAVAAQQRLKILPQVPTTKELGHAGVDLENWFGIAAPKGTPPAEIKKIHAHFAKAMQDPELIQSIEAQGMEAVLIQPEEFKALIQRDIDRLAQVVAKSQIAVD